jgi:S-adenosylmethionine synthetase
MTDRNVRITVAEGTPVDEQAIEVVERKGIGHPDSICDGVAEAVSRALAQTYLDRVGEVLHFNTDETQLVAGSAAPDFGGGEVIQPIYLLIVGRATMSYEGTKIPAETIALETAREYLTEQIPELDVGTDIVVDVRFGEGSGDLQQVFDGEEEDTAGTTAGIGVPMANDTSYGVGFGPFSETERIVYEVENGLNGEYAADNPALGPDVKVMGKREGESIDLTVAAAIVDAYVNSVEAYREEIESIREYVTNLAESHTDRDVTVHVNTADDYDAGKEGLYLTVTGTSAEMGDDGSVGRGNRANGLITPDRPMSMEASSGKNPVNHIGKIYNLLSNEISDSLVQQVEDVTSVRMRLLSQIGRRIDEPHLADAQIRTADGVSVDEVEAEARDVIAAELDDVTDVTRRIIEGDLTTF